MAWLTQPNLVSAYLLIVGSIVLALTKSSLFFINHVRRFDKEYPALSSGQFHWLTWPAIAANFFFERLFGQSGENIRALYTWRSVSVTLVISLLANSICVFLILTSTPEDLPVFDPQLIKMLGLSYFVFVVFNFLGDLVSVNITRNVLSNIISEKCNFLRYLFVDILGIILGYVITLLPSIAVLAYSIIEDVEINEFIHEGFLGSTIIPFFLFIFATTNMPVPFSIFAFIAIFSITIPTAIYISLMGFCYFGYRIYQSAFKEKDLRILDMALNILSSGAKILLYLAPLVIGISIVWQKNW